MSPLLRDAVEADLVRIVEIYNESIPGRLATADLKPVPVESRRAWFHAHSPSRRPIWVLDIDGQVEGWISLSDFYGRPAYQHTAEFSLYLSNKAQGRGHGRMMLERLIGHCPSLDVDAVVGYIVGHNHPSLSLCRSFGFREWGRLPGIAILDGVRRDLVIMGLKLEA